LDYCRKLAPEALATTAIVSLGNSVL
jgi:hypothetical protein